MPQEKSSSAAAIQATATTDEIPGDRSASGAERLSRLYDVALKTTTEGILGIDAGGVIDFANPAAARLLGRPVEDLVGHAASDILGTASHFLPSAEMPGKACFLRGSGHPFAAEFRLSPRAENDARQGTVMVFADITARQSVARELQESEARLREALRLFHEKKMAAIGQLAAGVAHAINNPVAFIAGNLRSMEIYAEELLGAAAGGSPCGRCGARNDDASACAPDLEFLRQDIPALFSESGQGLARIAGIVQHLRTFSQIDVDCGWGLTDVNPGLQSALRLLSHNIGAGVEILNEMSELPPIECQAAQINQVFFNLLSNAIRAVGNSGKIWLRSGSAANAVWIEVADDGCGIAPKHLEQLFEPFFTTCAIGQGMGLGLSVAYGIVKRHGGQLLVSSRAGKGTEFRILLPVAQDGGAGSPAVLATQGQAAGELSECRP